MWNSRSQRVVGLAMSHEDMACLHVYQTLDEDATTKSTTYILQFLWRDLTSPFDVVGPYYSSSGTLEAKFILGIVLETIKVFHLFGFNTSLLVCDGASSTLQWEYLECLDVILLLLMPIPFVPSFSISSIQQKSTG